MQRMNRATPGWLTELLTKSTSAANPDLWVVGAPSSGTRLLVRLLSESGLTVNHDHSHGHTDLPGFKVVTIARDREAVVRSCLARDDSPAFKAITTRAEAEEFADRHIERVQAKYPNSVAVSYEALIADRDAELAKVAVALGIPAWSATEAVTDENAKHLKRKKSK